MRIGVLGGTFDPVHAAHLAMARAARKVLKLDLVLLVPARISPFKKGRPTPARHRLAMVRTAAGKIPWLKVATLELRRPAPSYTVDTLKVLKKRFSKGSELHLLIGADSAKHFHKWKSYKEINKLSTIHFFARPGSEVPRGMHRIPMRSIAVSASMLRASLAGDHRPPAGGIPGVLAYARKHRLYLRDSRPARENPR